MHIDVARIGITYPHHKVSWDLEKNGIRTKTKLAAKQKQLELKIKGQIKEKKQKNKIKPHLPLALQY